MTGEVGGVWWAAEERGSESERVSRTESYRRETPVRRRKTRMRGCQRLSYDVLHAKISDASAFLVLLPDELFEFGLVLGLATGARRAGEDTRGFGLAHALTGIGFYRFGGRKTGWLAFPHAKVEYGIDFAGAKVPVWSHAIGAALGLRAGGRDKKET